MPLRDEECRGNKIDRHCGIGIGEISLTLQVSGPPLGLPTVILLLPTGTRSSVFRVSITWGIIKTKAFGSFVERFIVVDGRSH